MPGTRPKAPPNRRPLNDRFVKTVKPEAKRVLIWDTLQRGLALQVEPTGHKSYKLVYPFGGRQRWYTISTAIGLKEARKTARKKLAAVENGVDVQAEKIAARKAGTFEDLAARYLEEYAKRRNKSWKQPEFLVRRYLKPVWGKLQARTITRGDVRTVFRRLTNAGTPVLANQVLAAASAIFSWGVQEEVADLPVNPCQGIERNPTKSRERVISDRELPSFWKAFDEGGLVRRGALQTILLTGQRPGEVCHMRREHIEGSWWTLPGEPDEALGWPGTKNGQTHRVWLPEPARAIIAELDEGERGFVFTGPRGSALAEDQLSQAMRLICKNLGIEKPDKVTPHDLRRTHGTTVTSLGFTREQMNRLHNHKEGGIGSVYDRYSYADEIQRIQEAVAARIVALAEGREVASNVVGIAG